MRCTVMRTSGVCARAMSTMPLRRFLARLDFCGGLTGRLRSCINQCVIVSFFLDICTGDVSEW